MADLTRITLNLVPKAVRALSDAAQLNEQTRTDTVNRAIVIYEMLTRESSQGTKIILERPDGTRYEMMWLG